MSTKLASLKQTIREGGVTTGEAAVLAYLSTFAPVSRDAMCEAIGMRISTACAHINALMKRGLVQEAAAKVYNPVTRRWVHAYERTEHAPQPAVTTSAA